MAGNRVSTRMRDYDYRFGAFFITLVVQDRRPLFGRIVNAKVELSPSGTIVQEEWLRSPALRKEVRLDEFIIMPVHFQAIAIINASSMPGCVGGACWRPWGTESKPIPIQNIQPISRSLARMLNQFKATVTRRINELRNTPQEPVWQRGYHDRIIRNEVEFDRYRKYIRNNPREAERKAARNASSAFQDLPVSG